MRHSFHISHISLYHYIIISTLLLLYLKVSNVIKNFIINISIQKFHSSYLVSQQRTVSIYEKALDRHRLIHRMSELHHDEIKGPPSTQTDFVNFLVVISGNYNYEITISFAPETRVIRGWIIVSPKLLANELPPEAVLPRIINWPRQKALNATESPNHVDMQQPEMEERCNFCYFLPRTMGDLVSVFPDIYTNQLSYRIVCSPSIYSFHDFCSNPLVMPLRWSFDREKRKNEAISSGVASAFEI